MSHLAAELHGTVLHVCPALHEPDEADPSTPSVAQRLAAASIEAETCGDVYRALARLCSTKPLSIQAVIVCVDDLGAPELSFFSLVRQVCRGISVYVYGHERAEPRIARAIQSGATGRVSEEVLTSISQRCRKATPWSAETKADVNERKPEATAPVADAAPQSGALGEPPAMLDEEPTPRQNDKETPTGPARVPWLRYLDTPVRTPPKPVPPTTSEPAERPPSAPRPPMQGPLLSPEELEALIGNDPVADSPEDGERSS